MRRECPASGTAAVPVEKGGKDEFHNANGKFGVESGKRDANKYSRGRHTHARRQTHSQRLTRAHARAFGAAIIQASRCV